MSSEGPEKEMVHVDETAGGPIGRRTASRLSMHCTMTKVRTWRYTTLSKGNTFCCSTKANRHTPISFGTLVGHPMGAESPSKQQRADNEKFELVIIDARGAKHGCVTRLEKEVTPNVTWSRDSKRLFFSQKTASRNNRVQLYTADADSNEAPQLFAGQDALRANTFAVPSPDGKRLLVVSRKPPPAKGKTARIRTRRRNNGHEKTTPTPWPEGGSLVHL